MSKGKRWLTAEEPSTTPVDMEENDSMAMRRWLPMVESRMSSRRVVQNHRVAMQD